MSVLPIIEEIENDIPDIEEVEIADLEVPEETYQFRRYLYGLMRKEQDIERIKQTLAQIIERYDVVIKAKSEKVSRFKDFLKSALVLSEKFKTKTCGYTVEIPDIGKFSATKPSPTFTPGPAYTEDKAFFVQPAPKFSTAKFNEFLKSKIESGEWAIADAAVVHAITGECMADITVSHDRRYSFPKG